MARLKKPVKQYTRGGKFIKMYDSCKTASVTLDIDKTTISKCCNFEADTAGGFRFEFIED